MRIERSLNSLVAEQICFRHEPEGGLLYIRDMFRAITVWLLLVVTYAQGQNDSIFPSISGYWFMQTVSWDFDGTNMNFIITDHDLFYSAQPEQLANGLSWGAVTNLNDAPIGLLAVDGSRIYFKSTGPYDVGYETYYDTTMRQVYDFNLAVGDTAYMGNPNSSPYPVIVYDIDTAFIASAPRRRFQMDNGDIWVEGVGSLEGLLRPLLYTFENGFELLDYCGEYLDTDSVQYTGCWPTGVGANELLKPEILVHPNPNDGEFSILNSDPGAKFSVWDMRGATVATGRVVGASTRVRLPTLATGLYVLDVNDQRTKLIIE